MAKGDMAHGIALYRDAVALDPVNPHARSFLAYNLASRDNLPKRKRNMPASWN